MPFDDRYLESVGFVLDAASPGAAVSKHSSVGTFFVVQVPSERVPDRYYRYAITAQHVVKDQGSVQLQKRRTDGDVTPWQPYAPWVSPDHIGGVGFDLAATIYDPPDGHLHRAIPIDSQATDIGDITPHYGAPVYFVGLLTDVKVGKPVVRFGRIAALGVSDTRWYEDNTKIPWTAPEVHLLDTRAWHGFSGSPCILQIGYPGPRVADLPDIWKDVALDNNVDPDDLGDTHFFSALWGMLVGHSRYSNIGIVIPIDTIRTFLDSEVFVEQRRKNDELADEKEAENGPRAMSVPTTFTRKDFMRDLHKATTQLDDQPEREES